MCLFDGLICVTILFCKGKTINGKRGMWQEKERPSMACLYAIEGRSAVLSEIVFLFFLTSHAFLTFFLETFLFFLQSFQFGHQSACLLL